MTHSLRVQTGTRAAVVRDVVHQLTDDAENAVRTRGQFALAIPGGSVAGAILAPYSVANLPWSQVHLFWVDERVVPVGSADSNAGDAMARIANSPMTRGTHIHRMSDAFDRVPHLFENYDRNDLPRAAEAYADTLQEITGTPPVLDVVLLGVGDDGHVASLFPGTPFMNAALQPVVLEYAAPKSPPVRMSLSASVLIRARHVILVAFGATKAAAMQAALEIPETLTPVAHVLRHAPHVTVALDHDAANLLTFTTQEPIP